MSTQKETSVLELIINGKQAETSMNGLSASVARATKEFRKMHEADDPKAYAEAAKNIRVQKQALAEMNAQLKATSQETEGFKSSWRDVAKGLVAGGAIMQGVSFLKEFGAQVIQTYTEFERYSTVLENSLGSQEGARRAMSQLQKLAAQTPFSLAELTSSYVKYVNRGIVPTMEQMTKLGDLASSQGKSFDQLTEAVLDASTGEFERLKEFGIRASKNGDMVALSFKGVTQEVKFSDQAIQDAILSFGEMQGVMGGMDKQSQTLGGRISNLSDSWDQMLVVMGTRTGGFVFKTVGLLSDMLDWITQNFKSTAERLDEVQDAAANDRATKLLGMSQEQVKKETDNLIKGMQERNNKILELNKTIKNKELDESIRNDAIIAASRLKNLNKVDKKTLAIYTDTLKQRAEVKRKAENEEARKDVALRQKEAVKQAKIDQKEAENAAKKKVKEIQDLKKVVENEFQNLDISGMEALDQIVANILKKYDPLIAKAKELGQTQLVEDLTNLRDLTVDRDTTKFTQNKEKADKENTTKAEKDQYDASVKLTESFWATQNQKAKEQYVNGELTKEEYDAKLVELERLKINDLMELNQAFGIDNVTLQTQLTDLAISEKERETEEFKRLEQEKKDFMVQMATIASDAVFEIIGNNIRSESEMRLAELEKQKEQELSQKNLTDSQKQAINDKYEKKAAAEKERVWKAEQRAKLAQAVMNGALALTAAWTNPFTAPFTIPLILATTAAQTAVIATQKAPKYSDGGVPDGPSHEQGGIKMIDGATGQVLGEMEGGEPIISKEAYAANKETIDQIIYGKARSQTYSMPSSTQIYQAERHYRTGGIAPQPTGQPSQTSSTGYIGINNSDYSELIKEIRAVGDKIGNIKVINDLRTFHDDYNNKFLKIRNDAMG